MFNLNDGKSFGHTYLVKKYCWSCPSTESAQTTHDPDDYSIIYIAYSLTTINHEIEIKTYPYGHDERVTSVDWSPDGKGIATIGNRLVQIYPTDIDELLQIAESRATRRFAAM